MDMEHEIPKKLGVLATHGDGEPPKFLDAHYVKDIIKMINNRMQPQFHYFVLFFIYTKLVIKQETKRFDCKI